ncbi:uncharacterized protein BO72DRAFT_450527 [Aspergillus fijiensis CBS 313.89]|uniref:Ketoreductase (KR) domain-containing protein n=1 Tax=Aspergillus fijiensis CBS 313.89 TaxID=1448319 RepID=A0A8G1VVZ3_9EURO|nr:uncharacterized protein BO72DRAFT_450527 [Aspergillus fijiensis CBS 313.89]RAK74642.1 hypothetical protein BO72DRAFT_450527 [Aspergillus fijiensis CBS 313.89]
MAMRSCLVPLKGVVQMAGCLRFCAFARMSFEKWQAAMAPKVNSTWVQHQVITKENLGLYMAFGCTVKICGNAGQADYPAANMFFDRPLNMKARRCFCLRS